MSGRGAQREGGRRRHDARKETQRERLIDAMTELAGTEGYNGVTIGQLIARAGVSRPTFYDYFPDTAACLLATVAHIQERLLAAVRHAIGEAAKNEAIHAAMRAVLDVAVSEPPAARVLMAEAIAGGGDVRNLRDEGLREIDRAIEQAYASASDSASAPDVSGWMVAGGLYRLQARKLRRGEALDSHVGAELEHWIRSYERPLGEHRWRTLSPCPPAQLPPSRPSLLRPVSPSERRGRAKGEDAARLRERILFTAAEIAVQDGYAAASSGRIAKRAGVDHRAFHRAFSDQHEVVTALHEMFYQQLMTVSAGAFFSEASWPQRVWDAGLAFSQAAEQDPTLAYVSFVEGPAAGPEAVQRYDDLVSAFTLFLEQGYDPESSESGPSEVAHEAIAWTTHEASYARARTLGEQGTVELVPHLAFVVLAPFLGVERADDFIDRKLREADAAVTE